MDLNTIFLSRHSFREYQNKEIPHKTLSEVLDAAKYAPSAGNIQNWVFIVITDKKKMTRLASACLEQYWISNAPILIAVCYDERNAKTLFPEKATEFSLQNVATASTYMILKATELNLGTCWIDIANKDEVVNCLKLPSHIIPSHILALGYTKGTYKKTAKNEIKLVTYFEEYGYYKKTKDLSMFPLEKHLNKIKKKLKYKKK